MMDSLKALLGFGPKTNYNELMKEGAVIIDVRTPAEFNSGHISGSKNIPLNRLSGELGKIKDKNKPVITCCASGMRSGSAKGILRSSGYTNVYNGGSWHGLQNKIS